MENVSSGWSAGIACRIAAVTIELSMPPERKQPSGTSATSCRFTDCKTSERVRSTSVPSSLLCTGRAVQRLLPHAVAGEVERFCRLVPDRQREHAVEVLDALLAPDVICDQKNFCIALGFPLIIRPE